MYLYHGPIRHLVIDGYVTCQPSVKLHRLRCLEKVSDTRAEICYMSQIKITCHKSEAKARVWRSYQEQRLKCGEVLICLDRRCCYRVLYTAAEGHLSILPISDATLLQCLADSLNVWRNYVCACMQEV